MAAPAKEIQIDFTAAGQVSDEIQRKEADLSITGTFTAAVELERDMGGNWVSVEQFTEPVQRVVENGNSISIRLRCSAHTSGTAKCYMS